MKSVTRVINNNYYKLVKRPFCCQNTSIEHEHPIVAIDDGKLRGKTGIDWKGNKYYSFQGIPYAKPPLGELRFKAPLPAEPWIGVKDAIKEGNPNYARHIVSFDIIGSEDCLYLNVYTPNVSTSLKPVMVWIYGGGFVTGSGDSDLYGPEFLMTEDVVLVTINYRLGLLGFASFEDPSLNTPGNAGLKDQVLALQWVQQNISKFGGDPSNVTIFGESAGASSVHYLLLAPCAKDLFHRAIMQSGTAFHQFAQGRRTIETVSKALQLKTPTEKEVFNILNKMRVEDLFQLQEKIPDRFFPSERKPIGPFIEPSFLADSPVNSINSGQYHQVPLMIGYTSKEGMYLPAVSKRIYGEVRVPKEFKRAVPYFLDIPSDNQEILGTVANTIKEFYFAEGMPDINNLLPLHTLNSDNYFIREINTAVELHTKSSSASVYYFRMSLESKLNFLKHIYGLTDPGMCHADDLGYFFKSNWTPHINPNSIEEISTRKCLKLWSNFAKHGHPNSKDTDDALINITWKPTETGKLNFIDISDNLTVGINPDHERMEFWKDLFKKYGTKSYEL